MLFNRLLPTASAVVLAFSSFSHARVTNLRNSSPNVQDLPSAAFGQSSFLEHIVDRFFRREKRRTCVEDQYLGKLRNGSSDGTQSFCNIWLDIPPATTEVQTTPAVTIYNQPTGTTVVTSWTTVRSTTTSTLFETTTTSIALQKRGSTEPRVLERAANKDQIGAIITSALESGTAAASSALPTGTAQISIIQGLSSACSCLNVAPTSTVTTTYTDPATPIFVNAFEQATVTSTSSIRQTQYTVSVITVTARISSSMSLTSTSISGSTMTSVSSVTAAASTLSAPPNLTAVTPTPSVTTLFSGLVPSGVTELRVGATAVPFTCPDADQQRITNIVGKERFEYMVLCNMNVVNNNTLFSTRVNGSSDCAVECSYANDAYQQEICQNAKFIPTSSGDNCVLYGNSTAYVNATGIISAVLINVYSSEPNCQASSNFTQAPGNFSANPAEILSAIDADQNLAISTPPDVFSTGNSGESMTYVSYNTTLSNGVIEFTWYSISASSSSWYMSYSTAWSCTYSSSRTLIVPGSTAVVTTVIYGSTTIIAQAGQSITLINGDGGTITPTSVLASLTSGGDTFSTEGAFSTRVSLGGGSAITPTPTATPGTGAFTISGGFSTMNFTVGSTAVSPSSALSTPSILSNKSALSGTGVFATSGSMLTINETISGSPSTTVIVTASQTTYTFITETSGSLITYFSTGGVSFYTPTPSAILNATVVTEVTSTVYSTMLVTLSPSPVSGVISGSLSGGVYTFNSTGGISLIIPTSAASGGFSGSASGGTYTMNSTGGGSLLVPTSAPSAGISGSTAGFLYTFNSTGGGNSLHPTTLTTTVITLNNSSATALSNQTSVPTVGASGGFTTVISGNTYTMNSTGGVSFFTPTPAITTSPALVSSGFMSTTAGNISSILSTGGSGIISASGNVSTTRVPSLSPTKNVNATSSRSRGTNTDDNRSGLETPSVNSVPEYAPPTHPPGTSSFTTLPTGATGSSGFPIASSNSTLVRSTGVSSLVSISGNSSLIAPTGSSSITPMAGTGTATMASNSTILSQASVTLSTISSNETSLLPTAHNSTASTGSNSGRPRSGAGLSTTSFQPSITPPPFYGNSSSLLLTTSRSPSRGTNSGADRTGGESSIPTPSDSLPAASANSTLPVVTGSSIASSGTIPAVSANSTLPLASGSGSGTATVKSSDSVSHLSANSTVLGTGSSITPASGTAPTGPVNSTLPLGTGTSVVIPSSTVALPLANSTLPYIPGSSAVSPSSSVPSISANTSLPLGSGTISIPLYSATSALQANSSGGATASAIASTLLPIPYWNISFILPPLGTGTTAGLPSATIPTLFNSTAPSICPTAVVSVETILITHTVPASEACISTNSTVLPIENSSISTESPALSTGFTVTSTGGLLLPTYSPTRSSVDLSAATSALSQLRVAGQVATQAQIDTACDNRGNIIFNGAFEIVDDNSNPPGWTSDPASGMIDFEAYPSDTQHTPNGTHDGRVASHDPRASITVSQPLTLCPNRTYNLTTWSRQYPLLAQCQITYKVGNSTVIATSPQESWTLRIEPYTAGSSPLDVSADLVIGVTCQGTSGILSADKNGQMTAEFDDLMMTPQ